MEFACAVFLRENREYMWVEFCVALMIAVLRVNPMTVPNEVLAAAGLVSTTDDEKGKFFMLMDEVILSNDIQNLYNSLQQPIIQMSDLETFVQLSNTLRLAALR
jgi:hypothetical protein